MRAPLRMKSLPDAYLHRSGAGLSCMRVDHGLMPAHGHYRACNQCAGILVCLDCAEACHAGHALSKVKNSKHVGPFVCRCGDSGGACKVRRDPASDAGASKIGGVLSADAPVGACSFVRADLPQTCSFHLLVVCSLPRHVNARRPCHSPAGASFPRRRGID